MSSNGDGYQTMHTCSCITFFYTDANDGLLTNLVVASWEGHRPLEQCLLQFGTTLVWSFWTERKALRRNRDGCET